MNKDRLQMMKEYYVKQETVLVEIPPIISVTGQLTKIIRFNGKRAGYDFRDGKAAVKRNDVYKLQEIHPNLIIHEGEVK